MNLSSCLCVLILSLVLAMEVSGEAASVHHGYVRFSGLPMPGVVIRATRGDKELRTVSDSEGAYSFVDLEGEGWTIRVEMSGFAPIQRDVTLEPARNATVWDLTMLAASDMNTESHSGFMWPGPTIRPEENQLRTLEKRGLTAPALLINGSVDNGESRAFGNNRGTGPPLYTMDLGLSANNSALDARSFSLTGQDTPKPAYNRSEASMTLDGPLFLLRDGGPRFTLIYGRTQNRDVSLQAVRVPTPYERSGDFSESVNGLIDPATGANFPENVIPEDRISPQAKALLNLYPLPNFTPNARYNYQVPLVGVTHRDNLQLQTGGAVLGQQLGGSFGFQSSRADSPNLFGFTDSQRNSAFNASLNWSRRLTQSISATASYSFRRTVSRTLPYFAHRENVSGNAGIAGNAQDPANWGPPRLNFSSGIASLFDGQHTFDRTQASTISYSSTWNSGRHALSFGGSLRREQLNLLSAQDARGTFTFTGTASGADFADFLLGVPTTSSIAFGSPDRYFRQSVYDAFVMDDWRVAPWLTLNVGVRWEYEAPMTERYGRLVNLDITTGFAAIAPVLATHPHGSLSGRMYPQSLVNSDPSGIQPRIGVAWRPLTDSTLVIRSGYGIYRDTSVYRSISPEMAQQPPFSTRLSVANGASAPLTLADGFISAPLALTNTFAVDPDFRVGYVQNWQLSLQQDLPAALQVTASYLGLKGTHLQQRVLPNTFPSGGVMLCQACPSGYVYLTSNGNSYQHAGTIQLRRRQRNGFSANLEYTWSKAIDDAGLGGFHIAQDWLNPGDERALSSFDRRHRMAVQALYTSGSTGVLQRRWLDTLLRGWTVMTEWRVSSGSPLTPTLIAPVQGTGMTGSLRPDRTSAPLYTSAPDTFLNINSFSIPSPGEWGNAGRNSISGPGQFSVDASIGRTFSPNEGVSIDLRVDFTNLLNHVTFANWNTVVNSSQFGFPASTNSMRTVRPSLRVRF